MPQSSYILALDQGTTSSRAILYDQQFNVIATTQKEFKQYFPKLGWVEHNANEIWESQLAVAREIITKADIKPEEIVGIGIANQRETTVVWNRKTGKPINNAIVWQDRRTADYCDGLKESGHESTIASKTGLVIDAYFSASKIRWILDNIAGAKEQANNGELAFGTIDSWLIWNLTNGESHITDVSNASRTQLLNIHTLEWDNELLNIFNIPASILPTVVDSSGELAVTSKKFFGKEIKIAGIAGDQQAALFGQTCFKAGEAKCTYGTGCFLVFNTGKTPVKSKHNLLTTVGWKIGEEVIYALEGSVFMGGATIQWLRDGLGLIKNASDSESLALEVEDNGGVYFVPAHTGLGAPYWDPNASGTITGITRGTTSAHITRAAIEGICFQVNDVIHAMENDADTKISQLKIDGGAVTNNLLVQFQANISQTEVLRPTNLETTALGAAYLAGIGTGLTGLESIKNYWSIDKSFTPNIKADAIEKTLKLWHKAVKRSKSWF